MRLRALLAVFLENLRQRGFHLIQILAFQHQTAAVAVLKLEQIARPQHLEQTGLPQRLRHDLRRLLRTIRSDVGKGQRDQIGIRRIAA